MWNERDIWLRHHERMAYLRHEAYIARLLRERRPARRKGGILAALLRWLRTGALLRRQIR